MFSKFHSFSVNIVQPCIHVHWHDVYDIYGFSMPYTTSSAQVSTYGVNGVCVCYKRECYTHSNKYYVRHSLYIYIQVCTCMSELCRITQFSQLSLKRLTMLQTCQWNSEIARDQLSIYQLYQSYTYELKTCNVHNDRDFL